MVEEYLYNSTKMKKFQSKQLKKFYNKNPKDKKKKITNSPGKPPLITGPPWSPLQILVNPSLGKAAWPQKTLSLATASPNVSRQVNKSTELNKPLWRVVGNSPLLSITPKPKTKNVGSTTVARVGRIGKFPKYIESKYKTPILLTRELLS